MVWTYISPAAEFDAAGARTGRYLLAGEEFTTNAEGKVISVMQTMLLLWWMKQKKETIKISGSVS